MGMTLNPPTRKGSGKFLFTLFNHTLTASQKDDAVKVLGVTHIEEPPREILDLWSQIPPHLQDLYSYLEPVRKWLKISTRPGDYLLLQGDFGAVFLLVEFANRIKIMPVYSTTERIVVEKPLAGGTVKLEHQFKHIIYRHYGR